MENVPENNQEALILMKEKKENIKSNVISFVLIAAFLALWEFGLPESLVNVLPRPSSILQVSIEKFDTLWVAAQYTVLESFLGYIIGNLFAILIAVLMIYSPSSFDTVYPAAVVLRSIPIIALTPFVVMFFGQGISAKVVIVALTCFFPTLINMIKGFTAVDKQALEYFHTLNADKWTVFWKLRVYNSLPYLIASLKITSSAAVLGAIVGEWMGAWHGLGAIIVQAMFNMQGVLLWAAMLWATIISVLAYVIMSVLEPFMIPWHETMKNQKKGAK